MTTTLIAERDRPFLEKVMSDAKLPDIYDARDITVVIFRTMRDLMTTDAADDVAEELHKESLPTKEKALQNEIAELWQDTNPLVALLSRIRPPLTINADQFLQRIGREAGLPRGVQAETAIRAVFSATKEELSSERSDEIASFLPQRIQELWTEA
ncbi:MAG: DUF2267 domain-containing protein [Elainellaceae cyanobacterium]